MKPVLLLAIAAACPLGAQPRVPTWTLSARPTLDIGNDKSVQTQFDGVTGILRMPAGEIVVANGLSRELRVFSATGEYLRTLTPTRAAGMRSLDHIWRGTADTIYAAEILPSESNVWTFTLGGFVSRHRVGASNAGGVYPLDRFPDGRYAVSAAPRRSNRSPAGMTFVDSLPLGAISFSQLTPKWFGALRNEMLMVQGFGRGRGGGPRTAVAYPYGRSTSYAISGDRLWIGDSETGTITQYSSSGRGLVVFSAPTPARALDTMAVKRVRTGLLSDAMDWNDRARIDATYSLPLPRTAPRFARFLPGVNGEMWIGVFREDPAAPRSYVVVDRGGAAVGRVNLPPHMVPLEIGVGDVLGVQIDDEGLEHVVRYTLRRNSP
jgi:hypothetical protein